MVLRTTIKLVGAMPCDHYDPYTNPAGDQCWETSGSRYQFRCPKCGQIEHDTIGHPGGDTLDGHPGFDAQKWIACLDGKTRPVDQDDRESLLKLQGWCPDCWGDGCEIDDDLTECQSCEGTGRWIEVAA